MRKIVVSNDFFVEAAEVLKSGKPVKLHIDGQSMYPFIHGGIDLVEVVPYDPSTELAPWSCPFYQWEGTYMIHRFIGKQDGECCMMGDGNLCRIERVPQEKILGVLRTIYHPDGSVQDCTESRWLKKGQWWYRLRGVRRFLIYGLRLISF